MSARKYRVRFIGEVGNEGRLKLANAQAFNQQLAAHKGRKVVLSIEEFKRQRTLDQNALYHLYLKIISDYTGDDVDYLHALFKSKYLPAHTLTGTFGEVTEQRSTALLTTEEFSQYLQNIEKDTGVSIPDTEAYRLGYSIG